MKERKTVYYKTEADDFFKASGELPKVDESYKYIKDGFFHKCTAFILYRLIATPVAFFYSKLALRDKYIGKEKLRPFKKQGYFVYSNHTQAIGDAFSPNIMLFPKKVYVIVGKDNLALPVIGKKTAYLGALPLPDNLKASRNFSAAVKRRISEGAAVVVYPEAHVWPYYNGVRDFSDSALELPVREGSPIFTATRVYRARKPGKKPRSEIYIDGPFMPSDALPRKDERTRLKEEIYLTMRARCALSDCEYIKYIKADEPTQKEEAE